MRRFFELAVPANDFDQGDHNIGVSTTGLLVLDVDNRKQGSDSLDILEMLNGALPTTYLVATPNGRHYYFRPPHDVANSASKLGDGLDVRGFHGYVVGAGSVVDGVEYRPLVDAPIAEAPQWLVDLCEKPREREMAADAPAEALDAPHNVTRARDYLLNAEPAIQGAGGNDHTYRTAAAVIDFGLSRDKAVEVMSDWNERCQPPWAPDELERMVDNAARYRTGAVGKSDPKTEFDVYRAPPSGIEPRPVDATTTLLEEPRRWLLGHTAIRGKLTVLIAPPGAGKSTLTLAAALSVAANKPILGMQVHEQTAAWLYNNEDDLPEINRRLHAAMIHNGISPEALKDRLYLNSGEKLPFVIAKRTGQGDSKRLRRTDAMQEAIDFIIKLGIGLVIFDPFSETHEGDENDNVEMREVASWFREIAQRANCAVILVHHTRKLPAGSSEGHAGNMDSGRGASSVSGVARVVQTLFGMSEKDAKKVGISPAQRHLYVRLDDAKATLSLSAGRTSWLKRETVQVPTSVAGIFEPVGVLAPVELAEVLSDDELLDRLVLEACGGQATGRTEVANFIVAHPLSRWEGRDTVRKRIERAAETATTWRIESEGTRAPGSRMIVPIEGGLDAFETAQTAANEVD